MVAATRLSPLPMHLYTAPCYYLYHNLLILTARPVIKSTVWEIETISIELPFINLAGCAWFIRLWKKKKVRQDEIISQTGWQKMNLWRNLWHGLSSSPVRGFSLELAKPLFHCKTQSAEVFATTWALMTASAWTKHWKRVQAWLRWITKYFSSNFWNDWKPPLSLGKCAGCGERLTDFRYSHLKPALCDITKGIFQELSWSIAILAHVMKWKKERIDLTHFLILYLEYYLWHLIHSTIRKLCS